MKIDSVRVKARKLKGQSLLRVGVGVKVITNATTRPDRRKGGLGLDYRGTMAYRGDNIGITRCF